MRVRELDDQDIKGFIDKQLPTENELAQKIKDSIKDNKEALLVVS